METVTQQTETALTTAKSNKLNDTVPSNVDFKIINDLQDYKFKRNLLQKRGGKFADEFNHFVLSSIWFFYNQGNNQINIINGLLTICHATHGMSPQRLGSYLMNVIPHRYYTDRQMANKAGSSNYKVYSPKFGKKIKTKDYDFQVVQEFIKKNPLWYRFGHNPTERQFSIQSYQDAVLRKLSKEGIPVERFTLSLLKRADELEQKKTA